MRVWISYTNHWKNHPRSDQSSYWQDARPLSLSKAIEAVAVRARSSARRRGDVSRRVQSAEDNVLPEPEEKKPSSQTDCVLAARRRGTARLEDAVRRPPTRSRASSATSASRSSCSPRPRSGGLSDEHRFFSAVPAAAEQSRRPRAVPVAADALGASLALEKYHYIGLGGPFLEDFRLVHARLGIGRDDERRRSEEEVHKRQLFNRPIASIECVHSTLEDYLDAHDFDRPAIVWFDYTAREPSPTQIERFARTIGTVPLGSVLGDAQREPSALGKPNPRALRRSRRRGIGGRAAEADDPGVATRSLKNDWTLFPSGLTADGMTQDLRPEPASRASQARCREGSAQLPRPRSCGRCDALRGRPGDGDRGARGLSQPMTRSLRSS